MEWYIDLIKNWKSYGEVGRVLVLTIGSQELQRFRDLLEKGDAILVQEEAFADTGLDALGGGFGLADFSFFRMRFSISLWSLLLVLAISFTLRMTCLKRKIWSLRSFIILISLGLRLRE